MGKAGPRSLSAIDQVVDVLRQDFDAQFKPVFLDTAKSREARPYEAVYEAFNALEHLTNASKLAVTAEKNANPALRDQLSDQIDVQLWQARRHLALGRFFCIEHQIVAVMYTLVQLASTIGNGQEKTRAKQQARATELEKRLKAVADIKVVRLKSVEDLIADTHSIDRRLEDLTKLLNEFQRLASDVTKTSGKRANKRREPTS